MSESSSVVTVKSAGQASPAPSAAEAPFAPHVPASVDMAELTPRAVILGVLFGLLFGASSVYLALKVGLTVSASVPIAVMSIVILKTLGKGTILENNIVQTVGSAGESIATGTVFVIPAILLFGYDLEFSRVTVIAIIGGLLGVLLMIPLRRSLIVKEHGKLKYPEGVACAEVLIAGEEKGSQAKTIFQGGLFGIVYKLLNSGTKLWQDVPEKALSFFKGGSVSVEVSPELLGVGYIIGYRTAATMFAGGVMSYLVLIPAIKIFGEGLPTPFHAVRLISEMTPVQVRGAYVLYIGAGAVAAGGLINLARAMPTIVGAFREGLKGLSEAAGKSALRTERDISMRTVLIGVGVLAVAIAAAPILEMTWYSAVLVVLFGFFFATVSSRIVGEIGSSSNPVSGMTVAALLGTCLFFLAGGKTGIAARVVAISVGAIVCVIIANAGATSQDLKTGFLVGATPRRQQIGILIGAAISAFALGGTLLVMNASRTVEIDVSKVHAAAGYRDIVVEEPMSEKANAADGKAYDVLRVLDDQGKIPKGKYLVGADKHIAYVIDAGIGGRELAARKELKVDAPFDAPKATLMSYIVDGILQQKLPWAFVLLGVFIALVLELCGVQALPFAVGLYLPLSSSAPIFCGGVVRLVVDRLRQRRGERTEEGDAGRGVLFGSGLIAGGSVGGLVLALLGIAGVDKRFDLSSHVGVFGESFGVALVLFAAMAFILGRIAAKRETS